MGDAAPGLLWCSLMYERLPPHIREKLAALVREHETIESLLADPVVLSDHRRVRELSIRKASGEKLADEARRLRRVEEEIETLAAEASGQDPEMAALARDEIERLGAEAAALSASVKSRLVNAEDRAVGSVILEIRAGTGGDEAALWARDLLEMYEKLASHRGWGFEILDFNPETDAGGIKNATASLRGEGVWSELAFEAGVHSVKRVPATEAQGRIHTSTATVAVLPEPREVEVRIDWARDVEEHVTTSQGPGGQNVNKVATAVQLHHKPTGILIRMQESKSQQQNRERARRLLAARLHEIERQKRHAERAAARTAQIGGGERSEKIRTYRFKEGIVADERLPGEYSLREVLAGNLDDLTRDLAERETLRRLEAL